MSRETTTFLKNYQHHLHELGLSQLTIQSYCADLERFRQWFEPARGRPFTPENIVPADLVDYKSFLRTVKQYQPATVNRHLSSIARFLKWARGQGLTETLPPEKLQQKPRQATAPKSLNQTEQHALTLAVNRGGNPRDVALIKLLLGAGLRSSEVAHLKLADVELLPRSAGAAKGWVHVRAGKGDVSRRVPLNSEVRKALRAYLDWREDQAAASETEAFFIGERGRLTTKGVAYIVRKYAYQAQLLQCSVHTLRHTFAKNLIDQG
ncbi:MAG TPA: tyrosine-type recombinase/integrase, partial [Anaerolineae bacterium]|nr:tyrosine-type recombinase/integrase [Anaerolineae bacterium]